MVARPRSRSRAGLIVATAMALLVGVVASVSAQSDTRAATDLTPIDGVTLVSSDTASPTSDKLVPVIIKLDEEPLATYQGGVDGFSATSPKVLGTDKLDTDSPVVINYRDHLQRRHADFAAELRLRVPQARVTQSLDAVIGGVAAVVPENSIDRIRKIDGVVAVIMDSLEQLDTDVTPGFIGADDLWEDLGGQSSAGEGIIVANIDSGIWPEHPSVSDPDPDGNPYPAPPAHWAGSGTGDGCDFGNVGFNPDDAAFTCNNKLVGAYDFTDTYSAVIGLIPTEFDSARDSNGHGTHTLTTAAGNGNVAVTLLGVDRGTVSGIAPRAHVVAYKGCGLQGCFSSDTLASINQAVLDGVDVVNYSISGGGSPYSDVVSLGFLDAYDAGVLVVPSAGNSGPGADTVAHREPWTLTVGASTSDRHFLATATLTADNSDTLELTGASVTSGISTPTDVVLATDFGDDGLCLDPFAPGTFNGEIVVCERGAIARVAKSFNVAEGGAGGLLLYNPVLQGLATDNHFIPSIHLENDDGVALLDFMATHTGVTATMTDGLATTVQGDKMAAFSSRGGPGQTLGISKPDVTAPGVQILAGHTPLPENQNGGLPGQLFQSIQGTSMSAPHATGSAALVLAANPDWGPGQIKSALMMTALKEGVVKEDGVTPADAFDYGSGRVLPDAAADALMTISESAANFVALEDHLWDANYPSLYVPVLAGAITVERTLHDESGRNTTWRTSVQAPSDLHIGVPRSVRVPANGDATMSITVDARDVPEGETRMAMLTFMAPGQELHFPIVINRADAGVTIDKTCEPGTIAMGDTTTCTITVQNNLFEDADVTVTDRVPNNLRLVPGTVVGGSASGPNVSFAGTLGAAAPPLPDVAVDPTASAFGYVGLAAFGGTLDIGATDETIANFIVPAFDFAGESYEQIGIVSNGYIVVGGGSGADVDFINTDLPDPAVPNNVLAPFWTDLNPAFGGRVLVNVLSDGVDTWTVVEWESVSNFGDGETNTFQVWIGTNTDTNPGEDISFVYGADISDGDGGFLTIGVENSFGNAGGTVYFNGIGTVPAPSTTGYEVDVFSVPGAPGGGHVISFDARGTRPGDFWNYAVLESDSIPGSAIAGFHGTVTP